jgi:hypothetical protein
VAFRPLNRSLPREGPSQAAGKPRFVTGHDFSRAVNAAKSKRALAPEGCFSDLLPTLLPFSAACSGPGLLPAAFSILAARSTRKSLRQGWEATAHHSKIRNDPVSNLGPALISIAGRFAAIFWKAMRLRKAIHGQIIRSLPKWILTRSES